MVSGRFLCNKEGTGAKWRLIEAIDSRIEENKENGISIEDAMRREKDADGNITEGNLQRLIRNFSDSANVSVLIIDNSTEDATVYSTSRDTMF